MPKITNEQKLQAIKDFLLKYGIAYEENYVSRRCGITIPFAVPAHRIAITIGDDQEFYHTICGKYYPIFIRNEDTKAKVLEKIQNTIIKSMTIYQKALQRKARREEKQKEQWISR